MVSPRVSVLITLYNKGPFVEAAVRSVLEGTFQDLEVLVVDDASTDDGLERVRALEDPRIRLLKSAVNTGRPAAANRGYDAARGEYVAVLDADDLAAPTRLEKQVAYMDAHPEVGVAGSFAQLMDAESSVWEWPATDAECRGQLPFKDPVLYGSAILRRSVLQAHDLRCDVNWLRPGMDYLFLVSMASFVNYGNVQEVLTYYRVGSNNMRHGRSVQDDRRYLLAAVFRSLGMPLTDHQLDLQLQLNAHDLFPEPADARRVGELWEWKERLRSMVRENPLVNSIYFEKELDRRWRRMFYRFADHDVRSGLLHMRRSREWPSDRLTYLIKTMAKRFFQR